MLHAPRVNAAEDKVFRRLNRLALRPTDAALMRSHSSTPWLATHNTNQSSHASASATWTQAVASVVQPSRLLTKFPVELVLEITDHLGPADITCLALACKATHHCVRNFKRLAQRLNNETELHLFLERLERDTPGMVYCAKSMLLTPLIRPPAGSIRPSTLTPGSEVSHIHNCQHLHQRKKTLKKTVNPDDIFLPISSNLFFVSFCEARIATNSVVLGPQWGVSPASALAAKYQAETDSHGIRHSESWQARTTAATKELMLSCTKTWTYQSAAAMINSLGSDRDNYAPFVVRPCRHEHFYMGPATLKGLLKGWKSRHSPGRCNFCYTEWTFTTSHKTKKKHLTVTIETYHDFGPCRSHDEDKWMRMQGTPVGMPPNHIRPRPKDALGTIVKLWEEGTVVR